MIKISDLLLTQDSLRNIKQIPAMYEFVKSGGRFDLETVRSHAELNQVPRPKLIGIFRLTGHPDEQHNKKLWLHDGNHRVVSIARVRDFLYDDECRIEEMPYSKLTEINLAAHWITPFDPLTHVRIADFGDFRAMVEKIHTNYGPAAAEMYIRENLTAYTIPRTPSHDHLDHFSVPIWKTLGGMR
jgi:hypothetical protein